MSVQARTESHTYDLPPAIVWDALVDGDLVSGWLAEAQIDARVGGHYDLVWVGSAHLEPTQGQIAEIRDREQLIIETSNLGVLHFTLSELPGGSRGVSTLLRLSRTAPSEPALSASTQAHWRTNLDQLDSLLHGKPVDWAHWDLEWGPVWKEYFASSKISKPL